MKTAVKITLLLLLSGFTFLGDPPCGEYKGHRLYKGPKGGCYYKHKDGSKVYVDKSFCKC